MERAGRYGLHGNGVVLKLTYSDMKSITRSNGSVSCDSAYTLYREAVRLLSALPKRSVRLIGAGIYDLSDNENRQLSFDDITEAGNAVREQSLVKALGEIGVRYNLDFAGNLEKIYRSDILHKTVEYMRKHRK